MRQEFLFEDHSRRGNCRNRVFPLFPERLSPGENPNASDFWCSTNHGEALSYRTCEGQICSNG